MRNKRRNQTKKSGILLIYCGIFLIVLSTGFLIYQNQRLEEKKEETIHLETHLTQDIKTKQSEEQEEKKEERKEEIATPTNTPLNDEEDEITSSAIGVIRIDKIGIVLPILDNASSQSLIEGAGIVEDTDLPSSKGNTITVLAGHRGGRNENQTFLNINKLEQGDEIKVTTKEDILYYKVVGQEVIEATDWSKFTREEGKTKLFLISCHPYPQNYQRLLIKAELIKDTEVNVNEIEH